MKVGEEAGKSREAWTRVAFLILHWLVEHNRYCLPNGWLSLQTLATVLAEQGRLPISKQSPWITPHTCVGLFISQYTPDTPYSVA